MKNTYLKFIFYFFVLLLLNVFSNDLVGNPNDFISEETSAMQEWECDCAEDAAECLVLCLDQGNCCCEITWEFEDAQPWPTDVPTYCKEWPNATGCSVNLPLCGINYQGEVGNLCTSTFDYPNNPYYLRPSYFCLEEDASLFIHNPTSSDISITIKCQGNNPGQGNHSIPAGQFVVIKLDDCNPNMFCSQ